MAMGVKRLMDCSSPYGEIAIVLAWGPPIKYVTLEGGWFGEV